MRERINLWRLHNVAEAYGKRPSELLNMKTALGAWQFDEACLMIGRRYENMLNEGKNPFGNFSKVEGQKSYSPMPKQGMKRMKIPANGIW